MLGKLGNIANTFLHAFEQIKSTTENFTANFRTPSFNNSTGQDTAINYLTAKFAAAQAAQPAVLQQIGGADLTAPVEVNFETDFPGKSRDQITQADVLQKAYEKLADRANLGEPYRTNFLNNVGANNPNLQIVHLDGERKNLSFTPDEFTDAKKSQNFTVTMHPDTLALLKDQQSEQRADNLIAEFTDKSSWSWDEDDSWFDLKWNQPFNEAGLGRRLAELSKSEPETAVKVLEKLQANNRQADAAQVANSIAANLSDEDLINLAASESGKKLLDRIEGATKTMSSGEAIVNRINIARAEAAKAAEEAKKTEADALTQPAEIRELTPAEMPAGQGVNQDVRFVLPEKGDGYVVYNPNDSPLGIGAPADFGKKANAGQVKVYDQVGTKETIERMQDLASDWKQQNPDKPLEYGDMSIQGGVDTGDHKGHQTGKIFDVRPIRTDNKHGVPGKNGGALNYNSSNYDLEKTKALIRLILKKYPNAKIIFNDPKIHSDPEFAGRISKDPARIIGTKNEVHEDHLHVELP